VTLPGTASALWSCQPAPEHHDGVDPLGQAGGEVLEEQVHDLGADAGQHEGEVLAGGWAHGGEDIGPLVVRSDTARGHAGP